MTRTIFSNFNRGSIQLARQAATLLVACAAFGLASSSAFAQARPSRLLPNRDSAPPGASVTLAVQPALATRQPPGSRLLLRSTRRNGGDLELRVVEWRGDALRAQIPRDAQESAVAARFVLLDRRAEVLADSGNRMFRVASRVVPNADRVAGSDPVTGAQGRGWGAPRRDLPGDVAGRSQLPSASRASVPPVAPNPGPDPRSERGVVARPGGLSTPGVAGEMREVEVAAGTRRAEGQAPQVLRDVRLLGMDYRHFAARSAAECSSACAIEGRCKSWTLRPAQRNDTFDNGDDGPVCWLKSGTPQREYARGYVSGIKPSPPAVGRAVPPPPVVQR